MLKEFILYLRTRKIFKKLNKSRLTYKEYNNLFSTVETLNYVCQEYIKKNKEGFSKELKKYHQKNNKYKHNLFDKITLLYLNSRINDYENILMLSSRMEYL